MKNRATWVREIDRDLINRSDPHAPPDDRIRQFVTLIQRTVEISVIVEQIEGTAPVWHPPDPGEPDQYGVIVAMGPGDGDEFQKEIKLTKAEAERAICQVITATTKSDAASASDQLSVAIATGQRFGGQGGD